MLINSIGCSVSHIRRDKWDELRVNIFKNAPYAVLESGERYSPFEAPSNPDEWTIKYTFVGAEQDGSPTAVEVTGPVINFVFAEDGTCLRLPQTVGDSGQSIHLQYLGQVRPSIL